MRKSVSVKFLIMSLFLASLAACAIIHGQESGSQYVDDATISTKIREQFVADPVIKPTEIHVETLQGVVELSGFVDRKDQEQRAVELARQTPGVKSVKDDIIVRRHHRNQNQNQNQNENNQNQDENNQQQY